MVVLRQFFFQFLLLIPLGWCIQAYAGSSAEVEINDGRRTVEKKGEAETEHAVVLIHGLAGDIAFGSTDYWSGIGSWIADKGGQYLQPDLGPYVNFKEQGNRLIELLDSYDDGDKRYNLICHSKGGIVCRYVLSERPDLVETIVTIGSPHHGTQYGCVGNKYGAKCSTISAKIVAFFDIILNMIVKADVSSEQIYTDFASLSPQNMAIFNDSYPIGIDASINIYSASCPQQPDQKFYRYGERDISLASWAGVTYPHTDSYKAFGYNANVVLGNIIAFAKNFTDGTWWAARMLQNYHGEYIGNDGLVPVCSTGFGDVQAVYAGVGHGDLVGQISFKAYKLSYNHIKEYIKALAVDNH